MRKAFYWPVMVVDCYETVRCLMDCSKNRVKLCRDAQNIYSFSAKAPLQFTAVNILGPFVSTKRGNKFLLVITDLLSKLARTVLLPRITAMAVAKAMLTHYKFVYGPLVDVLSNNAKKIVSKLFQDFCRIRDVKNVFETTDHLNFNGQVGLFNWILLAFLFFDVANHPKTWDLYYIDALRFPYKKQVYRTTGVSPFELVLSRSRPPVTLKSQPTLDNFPSGGHYN